MSPEAAPQRYLAQILTLTGVVMVIAGIVLAVVVQPILGVVSLAGIADLVMGRIFQTRAERAQSENLTGQSADPVDPTPFS